MLGVRCPTLQKKKEIEVPDNFSTFHQLVREIKACDVISTVER